ncbi:MAG: hypothetical protein HOF74_10390 [Gammaproteobacteria bacterium]|jgi:hypothetical protein|nr:hypothetical protein [Gammaproteobacteria bacterium]MBT3860229.1 hypothetical protein [Gammaproteobacteria bacterium]MBT3987521.1 hypothetical protein [Gammaproteobacteria bacterium]MBT4256292.1 hypothetical protein [Gammaproteobacteria bacterium]MBT4659601.1 hypothetical protein [Gammaproteobacteria bacterium]
MKRSSYWYIRLLTRSKSRPLFAGLATGAALLLIFIIWIAITEWLGSDAHYSVASLGIELWIIAASSYAVGVTVNTLEVTPRDVMALVPAMELDEKSLAREAATISEQSSAIHIWTLCWVLTAIVLTWLFSQMTTDDGPLVNELLSPSIAGWPYFRNLIYAFTLSQLTWIDITLSRRLGKLLEDHGKINLLDRSALQQLAKRARRSVLVWIPLVINSSFPNLIVALAVLIFPAVGIRRRYIEEKSLQLEKVRARIADRSSAVVDGVSTSESSNLPELVAWEQRLQQVKVWPYQITVYSRVFLYAGIGLASWVGAALVESFIGTFFG